jgi:hypothetical protein
MDTREHLAKSECSCEQTIIALLHAQINGIHLFGELGVIFKPINEEHGVPVNAAH